MKRQPNSGVLSTGKIHKRVLVSALLVTALLPFLLFYSSRCTDHSNNIIIEQNFVVDDSCAYGSACFIDTERQYVLFFFCISL